MTRAGGGSIVNIASGAGLRATPNLAFYSATKFAVRGITRSASSELAPRGIRVNAIFPGPIDTPMLAANTQRFRDALLARVPLRRIGQPDEVAEAALFLASDRSSFVTGAELSVDGGITA
jgi:3alpha(or 20beta)-hydroxysteroid dehydrogenase